MLEDEATIFSTMVYLPDNVLLDEFTEDLDKLQNKIITSRIIPMNEVKEIRERVQKFMEDQTREELMKKYGSGLSNVAKRNLELRAKFFIRNQVFPSPLDAIPPFLIET
jgi:hypothetical protein